LIHQFGIGAKFARKLRKLSTIVVGKQTSSFLFLARAVESKSFVTYYREDSVGEKFSSCEVRTKITRKLRSMRLRKWGQALFCLVFVLGITARAEAARLRLSVPVHGVSHVAFYAAKEKGYFQEEGLDVEVILMSGAIGIRALIAGDVDASTVGGSALPPIFRGAPLRMVFISFDKPTHWLYAKPDIRAVKDLKDKKVAVDGLGGTLESLLRSVLEKNGLEAGRDVPILAIGPPPGRFVALTSGAIDATLFTFPLNFRAEEAGFRELVNFVKQDIVSLTGSIVVRQSSDAGLDEKLVRGAVKGHLYARNNRSGTIPILARSLKIKEDEATRIYDAALPGMVADGSINEGIQRRVIDDTRKSLGMKESVSADKVFRFALVHKINAELKAQGWKPAP
jgi:ABC-type nitrate/sulfonate/bicarbonate transport system substrate-binding protein